MLFKFKDPLEQYEIEVKTHRGDGQISGRVNYTLGTGFY
jgi:hypothetical protein